MKPSKLYEALHALIGERVPLHIWGACGVGKSQIVSQVANDLDYNFLDVPRNSIRSTCAAYLESRRIRRNGCPRSFSRRPGRASSSSMN